MTPRLALVLAASVAAVACSGGDGEPLAAGTPAITASPIAGPPSPSPTTPEPIPTVAPSPAASAAPSPSDQARARFVASYRPAGARDLHDVAVDIGGDPVKELLFAYVVGAESHTQVDVASWTGARYEVTASAAGGPADELVDVWVRDVNADGRTDVVTFQHVGASGSSATLWTGPELGPLDAIGDCFDGRNTYGDTGVDVRDVDGDGDADVRAACEDPDLPQPLWPTVVYHWEDGAYRCDHREVADGGRVPCS